MQYTKTVSKWTNEKEVTYTSNITQDETSVVYEDCDDYNELLHTDDKFAQLTIAQAETMLNDEPYEPGFKQIEDYLKSINKFAGGVGCFNIST